MLFMKMVLLQYPRLHRVCHGVGCSTSSFTFHDTRRMRNHVEIGVASGAGAISFPGRSCAYCDIL